MGGGGGAGCGEAPRGFVGGARTEKSDGLVAGKLRAVSSAERGRKSRTGWLRGSSARFPRRSADGKVGRGGCGEAPRGFLGGARTEKSDGVVAGKLRAVSSAERGRTSRTGWLRGSSARFPRRSAGGQVGRAGCGEALRGFLGGARADKS